MHIVMSAMSGYRCLLNACEPGLRRHLTRGTVEVVGGFGTSRLWAGGYPGHS